MAVEGEGMKVKLYPKLNFKKTMQVDGEKN